MIAMCRMVNVCAYACLPEFVYVDGSVIQEVLSYSSNPRTFPFVKRVQVGKSKEL